MKGAERRGETNEEIFFSFADFPQRRTFAWPVRRYARSSTPIPCQKKLAQPFTV